jgi:hypothetical protein
MNESVHKPSDVNILLENSRLNSVYESMPGAAVKLMRIAHPSGSLLQMLPECTLKFLQRSKLLSVLLGSLVRALNLISTKLMHKIVFFYASRSCLKPSQNDLETAQLLEAEFHAKNFLSQ